MSFLARAVRATKAAGLDQAVMGSESQWGSSTYLPLYNLQTWTGNGIAPETALTSITVYQCVRILAETFAMLPLILYRRLPEGGKERASDHPLYRVLHEQPNPDMTSFIWRELMMSHLATWGDAFNEIAINGVGETEFWPLRPDRMEVKWGPDGRKLYTYVQPSGRRTELPAEKVFHVSGMSSNGLRGVSPVVMMARTLRLQNTAEEFGQSFLANGARPATVLSHPKTLTEPAINRLAGQMDTLRGSGNAGKTVVLEEGLTVTEVGVPPEAAQFMETRLYQKREIAAGYRIPAHKVGDLERATFSNIEHLSIEFIQDTMVPWFVRFEQEAAVQLFAGEDVFAEFLVDGYLRGDAATRATAFATRWQHGTLNADQWREAENENPLPDGLGQQYYVPVNYAPVNPVGVTPEAPITERATITEGGTPTGVPGIPNLVSVKSAEFRCPECNAKLAENTVPGMEVRCGRCKVVRSVEGIKSAERTRVFNRDDAGRLLSVVESVA